MKWIEKLICLRSNPFFCSYCDCCCKREGLVPVGGRLGFLLSVSRVDTYWLSRWWNSNVASWLPWIIVMWKFMTVPVSVGVFLCSPPINPADNFAVYSAINISLFKGGWVAQCSGFPAEKQMKYVPKLYLSSVLRLENLSPLWITNKDCQSSLLTIFFSLLW